jgi:SNF family Na+-dependent transporter
LALLLVGFPLLLLEIALGQHLQTADIGVFGSISKRCRGVGISAVACGFIVSSYYVPLISWVLRSFCETFGKMAGNWEDVTGADAEDYFFNDIVGMYTLGDDMKPTRLVPKNVFYLTLSWVCVGSCVAFGVKWTGRIAYFTMGFPILLLFIFFIRAVTLENASEGIQSYIGEWDMSILLEQPEVWSTAVSQIFFSLGTTFGIMTAFGSHCPQNSPATENAAVIAGANSFFSFISGFAVFGSLGYLKQYEGADDMDDVVTAGPALLFGAYPAVLSTLPGGIYWVRLLYFNLLLLGIDSAFALTESVLAVIKDSTIGKTISQKLCVGATIGCGIVMGIIYTTDAGIIFLDVIDFYINFIMILIGFSKAFSAGWVYGIQEQIDTFGQNIVYGFICTTFGSVLVASFCWFKLQSALTGFIALFVLYGFGMTTCYKALKELKLHDSESSNTDPTKENITTWDILYDLYMGNVLELKSELESSVGYIPKVWPFLLKHFIPHVLLILFINLAW